MTLDVQARPAPALIRLPARSSIAAADVELARHTVAELPQGPAAEGRGVLERLRNLVIREAEAFHSRS